MDTQNPVTIGETIRTLRQRMHLTQEELADGICSPVSVSRIENDVQMPSGSVLNRLLERLGTDIYQLCGIYYQTSDELAFEEQAGRAESLIRLGKIDDAKSMLPGLKVLAKDDGSQQLYLLLEAAVNLNENNSMGTSHDTSSGDNKCSIHDNHQDNALNNQPDNNRGNDLEIIPDAVISSLQIALALTKPHFDYDDFKNTLLTAREANVILEIAVAYSKAGQVPRGIRLGEELFAALKNTQTSLGDYLILKINTAFVLAQLLEGEGRYAEASTYCQAAESLSIDSLEQVLLPEIEFMKAVLCHDLGNDDECHAILDAVVPYMKIIKKTASLDMVETWIDEMMPVATD